ncbi:hypothetical protein [Epilithonimonas sp.]|uniref:hypothetical protein n=1 Tax=Epilithonimonas sp. TaxID=2894511 RepID=UPI0035B30C53
MPEFPPIYKINEGLEERMPDYHVFVVPFDSKNEDAVKFEVFYEKDFTEIQYEELKKIIEETLK